MSFFESDHQRDQLFLRSTKVNMRRVDQIHQYSSVKMQSTLWMVCWVRQSCKDRYTIRLPKTMSSAAKRDRRVYPSGNGHFSPEIFSAPSLSFSGLKHIPAFKGSPVDSESRRALYDGRLISIHMLSSKPSKGLPLDRLLFKKLAVIDSMEKTVLGIQLLEKQVWFTLPILHYFMSILSSLGFV